MVKKLMIKESNNKTIYDDIVKKVLTPYLEPYAESAIKLFDSPFGVYDERSGLVTIGESVLGNIAYNYAKENGYSSAVLNLVGNYYDVDSALVISVKDGRQRTYPRFKNIARNLSGSLKKELNRLSIKLNDVIRDIANELIREFNGVTNESINRGNYKMVRKINESDNNLERTAKTNKRDFAEIISNELADMDWRDYVDGNYDTEDEAWEAFVDMTYQTLLKEPETIVDYLEDINTAKSNELIKLINKYYII